MPLRPPNRVRERREALGISQLALAAAARVSRQSMSAIEAGRAVPGVDIALRIARGLDAGVEELFGGAPVEAAVATDPAEPLRDGRVALAQIGGRWVSYPLGAGSLRTSADGLAARSPRGRALVEPVRALAEARENVVLMGCAAALGLLADRLNARPGPGRFLWLPASSTRALEALARRRTHVAGVHLVDRRTGEPNVADVRRHAGAEPLVLVTLARWEEGLVLAARNPRRIRGPADLARRGVRLVLREEGSGARRLFDRLAGEAGLAARAAVHATGHLEVAQAVAMGVADAGVATRDAAIAHGLDFLPLAEERYDLALPRAALDDARIARLLDGLSAGSFRRELESLGYDARGAGERVAEVGAPP